MLPKLIILDVDGTLTDGGIYYDSSGVETKRFCVQDGIGIKNAVKAGIDFAIITGRECTPVSRRADDLGIKFVFQNIENKKAKLTDLMMELHLKKSQVAYIGDDLNDLEAMPLCGFVACPANACAEVKAIADYIARTQGGYGAVREILEYIQADKHG
jgi:3-deoxy-D-manno-octulosonate 8-phosphate phosphatase (KDO 8-P phosphatase)